MYRQPRYVALQLAMAAAIAVSMMTLSACREHRYNQYLHARDTVTLGAGDSLAYNRAVHTIDPWPAHARDPKHITDGKRMMLAIERYQKNESIEPQGLSTNNVYDDQNAPQGPAAGPGAPGAP